VGVKERIFPEIAIQFPSKDGEGHRERELQLGDGQDSPNTIFSSRGKSKAITLGRKLNATARRKGKKFIGRRTPQTFRGRVKRGGRDGVPCPSHDVIHIPVKIIPGEPNILETVTLQ